jgi:hypothetical protein
VKRWAGGDRTEITTNRSSLEGVDTLDVNARGGTHNIGGEGGGNCSFHTDFDHPENSTGLEGSGSRC